ncbi:MAG: hypothetical protein IKK46_00120 [Clostridia bacterium]|nr:hypothetical protein [Clostridia bacterium]MBR3808688.1 hypothetical protein [Clostridia bacterium]
MDIKSTMPCDDLHKLLNEGLIAMQNKDFKPIEEVFKDIEERFFDNKC